MDGHVDAKRDSRSRTFRADTPEGKGPSEFGFVQGPCTSHKLGPGKRDVDLSRKAWKCSLFVGRRCAFKQSDDFEEALFNFGGRCEG